MRNSADSSHADQPPAPASGEDRYARQVLFRPLGERGQERLHSSRVLVVGCGALGTHAAELLARAGIGRLRLVDRDVVEWSNLHRQAGFEEVHAREGAPKAEALASWLGRINSRVDVEPRVADFNYSNALDLALGCDILLDGTDNLPARFLLNDLSYRLGVPWIYAGAVGAEAHVQLFGGRRGPCLRCQLPDLPPPGAIATCDTAGVVGPAAAIAAAWQAALALRSLAEGDAADLEGKKAVLEPWSIRARVVRVEAAADCTVCSRRVFDALEGAFADRASLLCGRDAVQVLPASGGARQVDLETTASRLAPFGRLERRGTLIRLRSPDGYTLTLFADGRAIFDGLTDPLRARTLYTRLIGQ